MLRTQWAVRALTPDDRDEALTVCARNPVESCFVAARIDEGALYAMPGSVLGVVGADGRLRAIAWASANLVPVGCDDDAIEAIAHKVRRWRRQCASIFGPTDQVAGLWSRLAPGWGPPRTIRRDQPLLATRTDPLAWGITPDLRVRLARNDEIDIVLPAAAAMFTEEIGYPPYAGSSSASYRSVVGGLIRAGRTFIWEQDGRVLFKGDVGSVGVGAAQIQGVWLAPALRGQGLAAPLMAAVTSAVLRDIAPMATLYVNHFNLPARATYAALGFEQVGTFSTVLL
ncbi:MAG: GNAT family N-acetyltransferase [Candidatus Phosphoribacter sp.]|nr:GNAT family N-acetyltransferase [Actinomycetales bacterium]